MARVLLINAPGNVPGVMPAKLGRWIPGEQLGLCSLAATLRSDHDVVEILDACMLGWTAEQTAENVLRRSAALDVVGFSISDGKQHGAAHCLEKLSALSANIHLTAGGHTATLCAGEFLRRFPRLNSVIRGEGELAVRELCRHLDHKNTWQDIPGLSTLNVNGHVQHNPLAPIDLSQLPFPTRDNIELCQQQGFSVAIETSRGCKGYCTFCAARLLHVSPGDRAVWRARPAEHVLDELEQLVRVHGLRRISFEDEDFLGWGIDEGFERARQIAHGIIDRQISLEFSFLTRADNIDYELLLLLKQAGLRFIFLGVESGSQHSLSRFAKQTSVQQNILAIQTLQKLKIDHEILFIMYEPDTTIEDIEANLQFLNYVNGLNINLLNSMVVYHGTPMHTSMARKNRLSGDFLDYSYEFQDPRVTQFKKHANLGLSGFYRVLRYMDAIRWQIGENNDLSRTLSLLSQRLHFTASGWVWKLLAFVKDGTEPSILLEEASCLANHTAAMLAKIVDGWPAAMELSERKEVL